MTRPEFATLRDLVNSVQGVDEKLSEHKIDVERRIGRLEKGLMVLAAVVLVPKLGGTDASSLAAHAVAVATHLTL